MEGAHCHHSLYHIYYHSTDIIFLFHLYELTLYVSEGALSQLLCIHIVDMGTYDLHGLLLCVSEGILFVLLCIHIVGIETFDLHEWI